MFISKLDRIYKIAKEINKEFLYHYAPKIRQEAVLKDGLKAPSALIGTEEEENILDRYKDRAYEYFKDVPKLKKEKSKINIKDILLYLEMGRNFTFDGAGGSNVLSVLFDPIPDDVKGEIKDFIDENDLYEINFKKALKDGVIQKVAVVEELPWSERYIEKPKDLFKQVNVNIDWKIKPKDFLFAERAHALISLKNGVLPPKYFKLVENKKEGNLKISKRTKDMIGGGLADKKKDEEFDPKQLRKGIKVEMEHTNDPMLAKEIATDHLVEYPYYYDALEKMEKELEINASYKIAKLEKGDTEKASEVLIDKDGIKLTRGDIAKHYNNPSVRKAIMEQIKGDPILIYLAVGKNKNILKRNHNGKKIIITNDNPENDDDPSNYQYWVSRRLLSIHRNYKTKTTTGHVDLDLHGNYPFSKAKEYAKKVVPVLRKKLGVSPKIFQSGGSGIHIEFYFNTPRDTHKLHEEVKAILDEFNEDWEGVKTGLVKGNGMRSDTSTLRDTGSLRAVRSLGENTGKEKKPLTMSVKTSNKLSIRDIIKEARRHGVKEEFAWLWTGDRLLVEKNVHNEKELLDINHAYLADEGDIKLREELPRGYTTFYDDGKVKIQTYSKIFWEMPTKVQDKIENYFNLTSGQYKIEPPIGTPRGFKSHRYAEEIPLSVREAKKDDLKDYKKKRDFDKTPEPEGKIENGKNKFIFVIQRHFAEKAGHHLDLRLSNDQGTMTSFAIPKHKLPRGHERLLAVKTENHPISYNKFQGEIKEGYGKGKVSIHDKGTYELIEWKKDTIKFKLNGKKEKGLYTLAKTGKNWLIMKGKKD